MYSEHGIFSGIDYVTNGNILLCLPNQLVFLHDVQSIQRRTALDRPFYEIHLDSFSADWTQFL